MTPYVAGRQTKGARSAKDSSHHRWQPRTGAGPGAPPGGGRLEPGRRRPRCGCPRAGPPRGRRRGPRHRHRPAGRHRRPGARSGARQRRGRPGRLRAARQQRRHARAISCPMSPGSGPATSSGSCGPTSSHRCGSSRPPSPPAGGAGRVNVTSDAAVEGYEGWGGYGAPKAALEQLSRVLAAEETDVRAVGRPRRHAHADAPGRARARTSPTARRPRAGSPAWCASSTSGPSGRYRVEDLLQRADLAGEELVGQ